MKIDVLYFAAVRDLLGAERETVVLPDPARTVADLARALVEQHPALADYLNSVRFAVNESFAELHEPVADGDTVALIPPVAGG